MSKDLKYGSVTTEHGQFPDVDEPVFLLRAKDVIARAVLVDYLDHAVRFGCKLAFRDQVMMAIDAFDKWEGKRKLPD